jgi:organic hydroperoxide reductase OsmC/OhrA
LTRAALLYLLDRKGSLMDIIARVDSGATWHDAAVATNGVMKPVPIPAREGMPGSGLNGGELLCLALATCYGNDIYREAGPLGITVRRVEVIVDAQFGDKGEPASSISYRVSVEAEASEDQIAALIRHTDEVAEIQNTVRQGMPVTLTSFDAVPVSD